MLRIASLLAALLLAACASTPATSVPAGDIDYEIVCAQLESTGRASRALRWFHASAEQRMAYEQVFRLASQRVADAARGRAPGSWAVIVDADETLLDNSKSECADELQEAASFDTNRWTHWVYAEAATALPGAVAFAAEVRKLGGRLIVVSNREDGLHRKPTLANFAKLGIAPDAVLLAQGDRDLDKNRRFRQVQEIGVPEAGLPRLEVLAWVGDSIKDFPYLSQVDTGDAALFGTRYFLLPNPMYGAWHRIPLR